MPAAEGYENLTPYTEGLCGQWRPARLDYVARASRGLGLDAGAPLRICDLACGPGLSVLLQAAAAPHLEVVGIDFNPTHIHDARRRAAEHGLGNARFFNRGIEETDDLELGEFDVITMSGAYSWLAPEIRRAARAFVRKHLKPGGFFGVHVMSQPGWGSIEPVWKLARELAAPGETDPVKRHAATMALLKGLEPSGFLKNHPVAAKRIFARIREEFEDTVALILRIRQADVLLSTHDRLRNQIDRSLPLLNALNRLQAHLLTERRKGNHHKLVKLATQLTVNGIASALRNTG